MKNYPSVLLAVILTAVLSAAGCGNIRGNPAIERRQPSGSPEISGVNEFPIVRETTAMSVALPFNSYVTDYENNKFTKYLEEKSNVKIKFEMLPEKEYREKLNLLLNSGGKLPDVFVNCAFTNEMQMEYGSQGIFMPLDKLIEKNGWNIKEMLRTVKGAREMITAPDGNIYALPTILSCFNCEYAQRFWICRDFLDALQMEAPSTTDELYAYLKLVKEKDPNGNGKPDEIPLSGAIQGWYQNVEGFIMNAFVFDNINSDVNNLNNRLMMDADTIRASFTQPEFKEGLLYLRKLAKEGLLDPAAFTQDKAQLRQLVETKDVPIVGALPSGGPHEFADPTGERKNHYMAIPPLIGPKGARNAQWEKYRSINTGRFAISKDCKIPDIAIKWADMCYTSEVYMRGRYGEPGVDWIVPERGKTAVNGGPAQYREILKWGEKTNAHWAGAEPTWNRFSSDAREKDISDPFELEYVLFEAAKAQVPYAPKNVVPPFFFTLDESRKYNELRSSINGYIGESVARFITGDLDIEEKWDDYLEELDRIGLKEYLGMQQEAYDRQWKGK